MAVLLAMAAGTARAALIATDNFESYTAGAQLESNAGVGLNSGTGFTTSWNISDSLRSNVTVASQSLTYTTTGLSVSGGTQAMAISGAMALANNLVTRSFATQTGTVYFSFLYRTNNPSATSEDFLQIGFDDPTLGTEPPVSLGTGNSNSGNAPPPVFFVRSPTGVGGTVQSTTALTENTTYLVVGRVSKSSTGNYNRVLLYLNPTGAAEPGSALVTSTGDSGISSLSTFVIRAARTESTDTYYVDNLTIGTSYADVVPEPGVLTLLGLGVIPFLRRRSSRA